MRYEIVPVLSSSSMFLHEILLPQLKLTYSSVRKRRENLCSILPHYSQFDLQFDPYLGMARQFLLAPTLQLSPRSRDISRAASSILVQHPNSAIREYQTKPKENPERKKTIESQRGKKKNPTLKKNKAKCTIRHFPQKFTYYHT